MKYEILDQDLTPDGEPLELAIEKGHFVLRVNSRVLMGSAMYGSEREMAHTAAELLAGRRAMRVLVGGLGFGHTLRAALDAFPHDTEITVAELLPALIRYNLGLVGHLAKHPLQHRRVTLFEGDVREPIARGGWDAVLLDVDNGPDAMVVGDNASLYDDEGSRALAASLRPGGVAVVWSAYTSRAYLRTLRRAGLQCESQRVAARGPGRKGHKHVLFVARKPRFQKSAQPSSHPANQPWQPGRRS
jgi:spermidine synthase